MSASNGFTFWIKKGTSPKAISIIEEVLTEHNYEYMDPKTSWDNLPNGQPLYTMYQGGICFTEGVSDDEWFGGCMNEITKRNLSDMVIKVCCGKSSTRWKIDGKVYWYNFELWKKIIKALDGIDLSGVYVMFYYEHGNYSKTKPKMSQLWKGDWL